MLRNVTINCHSSIRIENGKTIYIDPFKIEEKVHDADCIFITHSHYDHLSIDDILKVSNPSTIYIATEDSKRKLNGIGITDNNIIVVKPNNNYEIEGLQFETVPSYNENKSFHPKQNNWVGYIIILNGIKYYIAGDTDILDELKSIKCDIAFLPIGGTYTMNAEEAAKLSNKIECKTVVPIHYGEIVGTKKDLDTFIELTKKEVEVLI